MSYSIQTGKLLLCDKVPTCSATINSYEVKSVFINHGLPSHAISVWVMQSFKTTIDQVQSIYTKWKRKVFVFFAILPDRGNAL